MQTRVWLPTVFVLFVLLVTCASSAPAGEGLATRQVAASTLLITHVPIEEDTAGTDQADATSSSGGRPSPVMYLTIFVLAVFIGFEVITKIPPTLHTPLMSGSNAISGITLVGAVLCGSLRAEFLTVTLGFLAIVFATINVVGGFWVTHRMLGMFRRRR